MTTYYLTIFFVFITSLLAQTGIIYSVDECGNKKIFKTGVFYCFSSVTTMILVFVAGFRYRVGSDYGNYIALYDARKINWLEDVKSLSEPGFSVISKIASLIHDNYATVFFLCSLITIVLYMNTIRKYSNTYIFSVLLFIFVGTWAGSFGAIRQYLAAAVLFAGHRYMYKKEFWKWILVVIIAMQFHRTAIVMLPVYFIARKKINFKTILILLVTIVLIRFSNEYIFEVMSFFKGNDQSVYKYMTTDVNVFRILVAFAPVLLYFLIYKRLNKYRDSETDFYIMMIFINAILLAGTSGSAYLARVGIFTETYAVLALPKIIDKELLKDKKIYKLIILSLYFIYFSYQIYSTSSLNNFQWIFAK